MTIAVHVEQHETYTLARIGVDVFDLYNAFEIRAVLNDLAALGPQTLIVDLLALDFMDSTALGVLTGVRKRMNKRSGTVALACTCERVLKIFRITGLTKVFELFPTVEEAALAGCS
jgi:anti-sigma B factor antagonist